VCWQAQTGQDITAQTAGNLRGKIFYKMNAANTGNSSLNLSTTNTTGFLKLDNLYNGTEH
jgi:hypothetical protein